MNNILLTIKEKFINNVFQSLFIFSFIVAFILLSFTFLQLLPDVESKLIDEKKYFLHQMTDSVKQTIINEMHTENFKKDIPWFISKFNYGKDGMDYYFLINENERLIAHPNPSLMWEDVKTIKDNVWFELWKEILNISRTEWEGYVWYYWPSKKDPNVTVPKLTFLTTIKENNWILATWIYIDDVEEEINNITWDIIKYTFINIWVIILILYWIIHVGTKIERDRKKIQREFASLIHNLPIWVFRLAVNNGIHTIMWNEAMLSIFWLTNEDVLNINISLIDFFKNEKEKESFINDLKSEGVIKRKEIEIINNKWENLWMNIGWNVIKEGNELYFDGSAEDITESHEIHKLLETSYEQLKKADDMKNEIIWITSHELRTPLTIIKWFASILKNEKLWTLTPTQSEYVDKITSSTEKLLVMINNMLDLTKLEAWETVFVDEEINIWDFINQVVEEFLLQAKKEQKTINIHMPSELIKVKYDPFQLKRVFINLIWNALKFIKPSVWVIDIMIEKLNIDTIEIKIKDNGKGIPEENIGDIFVKFKQIGWHMKRTTEGTGLGLSIVKTILEQMWTSIAVTSVMWEWSEFKFTLKIKK